MNYFCVYLLIGIIIFGINYGHYLMKTFIKLCTISILFAAIISACETIAPQTDFSGKLISHTDCKSGELSVVESVTTDTLSCIEYEFESEDNSLHLKHVNSGFNCCPGELYTAIKLQNDTIIVEESEREPGCKCNCLFDIEMELKGVNAQVYHIKIIEPYAGEQEKLNFTLDLTKTKEGSFCVTRKNYPWGMTQK
jgi:hypothetical protein